MVQLPAPSPNEVVYFVTGVLVGLPAPYWYAQERIRGFSRAMMSKLPYEPPPGKDKQQAMEEAVEAEDKQEDNDKEDN